ncbi:MFS transporter [Acetobacter indonesiensis]|uniref:MFS transporter n=1 Tax=Acetobacter indonesiensis TaxID=104101 RepID=A0A252AWL3_9PROT|nr:MFS transporter [Acetobacter indonesiensis]OUI92613.1 MFS transporter [Acetobacter indonesiensis]OUI95095.1 MFS transporter [Acetobacter indonesiensis]
MNLQHRALFAAMSGYAIDGFDIIMLSFLLPQITQAMHLTSVQAGTLMTWTLIGGAIGGILFGTIGDYIGRVRTLNIAIVMFSLFTFLCAFSVGFSDLLAWRILAGIGLGCEFGLGMTLVSEYYPATMRGRITSWVGISWQFGVLAASLFTPLLLPFVGWRGMFVIGGTPAVMAWVIRHSLPEPEAFQKTQRTQTMQLPLWELFSGWNMCKKSLSILCLSTIQNFGYYGLMIWLPSYLVVHFHLSLHLSGIWTAVSVCGMMAGVFVFGRISDKFGLKKSFLIYQCFAGISVGIYALMTTASALLFAGFIAGFFVNGMMGGYGALIASLYPTAIRSTAQNTLWSMGRAIGGLGPALFGLMLAYTSYTSALFFLSSIYIIDFLVTFFLVPTIDFKNTKEIIA